MPRDLSSYSNIIGNVENDVLSAVLGKNHSKLREVIKNSNLNEQDDEGNTCLHYVVRMASEAEQNNDAKASMWFQSVADYLVNHGAKTNLLNGDNEIVEFVNFADEQDGGDDDLGGDNNKLPGGDGNDDISGKWNGGARRRRRSSSRSSSRRSSSRRSKP